MFLEMPTIFVYVGVFSYKYSLMSKIVIAITLLLALTSVNANLSFSSFNGDFSSYDPAASGISFEDIITVANHYGCKTWVKNQCTECSQGWYFNKKGVCCEVPTLCSKFNRAEGVCEGCYQGYSVVDGHCKVAENDLGCAEWNGNQCKRCSKRWWMNAQGACTPISDYCSTWNSQTGHCETCYNGYILDNGKCIVNPNPFNGDKNPLCKQWDGQKCVCCTDRSYFDSFGICTAVSDQCQTWDPLFGTCLSCYAGYTLNEGVCEVSPVAIPSDLGCSKWNAAQDVCLSCSFRFYFTGVLCAPVSDHCATWDKNGKCTACYHGYDLTNNGECFVSNKNQKPSDEGCAKWDWNGQICIECSNNWVFNHQGKCVPVSDQCNTYDRSGACVSCYDGYNLVLGECVLAPIEKPSDLGCATWNWKDKICLQCSDNWVMSNGKCVPVSDKCKTFDTNGHCVSCYAGYNNVNGRCELAPIEKVTDEGCAKWNWNEKVCLQCSNNWVFNQQGKCVPVSDQCRTFDPSGNCVTCYAGYNNVNGRCELAPIEKPSDLGCATWNWKDKICLQCSDNWVMSNGKCVPVSDKCKTFDLSGHCVSCYKGYRLVNGKCELAPVEPIKDVGCGLWNWSQQKCIRCSDNWVFNNGICVPVSDQCKTFDSTGACVSCYKGYKEMNGKCELAPIQKPTDLGCHIWDWENQICKECSNNWVFNHQGQCVTVSDQCKTFDISGACRSCYKGYNLVGGKCELAPHKMVTDIGCGKWNWDKQICLACSHRFVFNQNRQCVPVNDNCNKWNDAGACTNCYPGYLLKGDKCVLGNSLCQNTDANGACTSCYTGYIKENGNCVPISKLASLALFYSQCCPDKLAELTAKMGPAA